MPRSLTVTVSIVFYFGGKRRHVLSYWSNNMRHLANAAMYFPFATMYFANTSL